MPSRVGFGRPPRWRRVHDHPRGRSPRRGRRAGRNQGAQCDLRAVSDRDQGHHRHDVDRYRLISTRWRHDRRAGEGRRRSDVPGEVLGAQHLPVLHQGTPGPDDGSAVAHRRPSRCAQVWRSAAPRIPAEGRRLEGKGHRARGARALGPPRPWPSPPRRPI